MPQLLIKHAINSSHGHSEDHTQNTKELRANQKAADNEHGMQIKPLPHNLGHEEVGIQLIIDCVENGNMQRRLGTYVAAEYAAELIVDSLRPISEAGKEG